MGTKTDAFPIRRFSEATFVTVIPAGISIRGELRGEDAVDLAGSLEGESRVAAHCRVRAGGRLVGTVEAQGLVVEGTVQAPEIVADKVEIGVSAHVQASLRARVVAIAEGAMFDGDVRMKGVGPGSSLTVFKEQRKPREGA